MAVRSGSGTGVVVSLIVFILISVLLLVMTLLFYTGQTKAREAMVEAEEKLADYIKPAQRQNERFKQYADAAAAASPKQSVVEHLHNQMQDMMQYVEGARSTSFDQMRTSFGRLGVAEESSVKDTMRDMQRELTDRESRVEQLDAQLQSIEQQNAELEARIEQLRQARQEQEQAIEAQLGTYRTSVESYREELDQTVADMQQRVDRLTSQYEGRIGDLQNEIDQLNEERVVHVTRINELEGKVRQDQLKVANPAQLVDGRIFDTPRGQDQVFINLGTRHHIVMGMTFEVYDSAAALQQVNPETGELPRGKASIQVIKVGDITSTCKIVRSVPGRPVVRDDVIANAVYDPNYKFKFLVHGRFDVDADGRPSEHEADFIRSRVVDWGGEIVTGDTLPGDLDFLVLGEEPPMPTPLKTDPTQHETDLWIRKREAHETYQRLKRQATDAQIPVLNANRFFILTGHTVR